MLKKFELLIFIRTAVINTLKQLIFRKLKKITFLKFLWHQSFWDLKNLRFVFFFLFPFQTRKLSQHVGGKQLYI